MSNDNLRERIEQRDVRPSTGARPMFDDPPQVHAFDAPLLGGEMTVREPMPAMAAPASAVLPELEFLARMSRGVQRDEAQMLRRARRVGEMLGERATYSFPVGGQRIPPGPTVALAEALAGEYGHLWWGTRIDRRDGDMVYMTSVVVDALRATVCTRPGVFVLPPAPGGFARSPDQTSRWESMQVQSAVSKCQRTALLHALPDWFIEEAVSASRRKVQAEVLGDRTIDDARREAVAAFVAVGVTYTQLAAFFGAPAELWTLSDIVELRGLYRRIRAGEIAAAAVFGRDAGAPAAPPPVEPAPVRPAPAEPAPVRPAPAKADLLAAPTAAGPSAAAPRPRGRRSHEDRDRIAAVLLARAAQHEADGDPMVWEDAVAACPEDLPEREQARRFLEQMDHAGQLRLVQIPSGGGWGYIPTPQAGPVPDTRVGEAPEPGSDG